MARYDEAGSEVTNPKFPFMLIFQPNEDLGMKTNRYVGTSDIS